MNASHPSPAARRLMSLVQKLCRNLTRSAPVSSSRPRSLKSTTAAEVVAAAYSSSGEPKCSGTARSVWPGKKTPPNACCAACKLQFSAIDSTNKSSGGHLVRGKSYPTGSPLFQQRGAARGAQGEVTSLAKGEWQYGRAAYFVQLVCKGAAYFVRGSIANASISWRAALGGT